MPPTGPEYQFIGSGEVALKEIDPEPQRLAPNTVGVTGSELTVATTGTRGLSQPLNAEA